MFTPSPSGHTRRGSRQVRKGRMLLRSAAIALALVSGLLLLMACGGGETPATSAPTAVPTEAPADESADQPADEPAETPAAMSAASFTDLEGLLGTKDLGVGANRVSFVLQTSEGLVSLPQIQVRSLFGGEEVERVTGRFHLWPFGTRGNYVSEITFDKPGDWQIEAVIARGEETLASALMNVEVKEESYTPAIGAAPPLTVNKTASDEAGLTEITTWPRADLALYQSTIPEALESGMPLVVVMSSPGFCTSPTCGPQVDTVTELKNLYADQANFIHVEIYDNPIEIQSSLDMGIYSPVVVEWGLTKSEDYLNESWVFIIDSDGLITAKYEGYASLDELESGLKEVL